MLECKFSKFFRQVIGFSRITANFAFMNHSEPLTRDLIEKPELWRLAMRADAGMLHVLLTSSLPLGTPGVTDNLIYRAIRLDASATSPLAALEEAIYANELLLNDYARVDWLTGSEHLIIVPPEGNPEQYSVIYHETFSASDCESQTEPAIYPTAAVNASALWSIDRKEEAFLRRTFAGLQISPALGVLINYVITAAQRGNSRRMYVNFREKSIDVIVTDRTRLLQAVTLECASGSDAAYYVMACRRQLGLSDASEPVIMSGESPLREECGSIVRRFVQQVLPAIFPSDMLKAGRDSVSAPFELIAVNMIR